MLKPSRPEKIVLNYNLQIQATVYKSHSLVLVGLINELKWEKA